MICHSHFEDKMKIIIQIPNHLRLYDIDELFQNRVLQYELVGNKLIVYIDVLSEVTPELIKVSFKCGGLIEDFVISSKSDVANCMGKSHLNYMVVQ